MSVRAILTADNHLDLPAYNFGPDRFERKKDFLKCFEEMVDYAKKEKPELLLIGGDVFDGMRPDNFTRATVMRDFKSLHERGVRIFAVSGHHDSPKGIGEGTSPLAVYGNSGVLHYFSNPAAPETMSLDLGFKVTITGIGHNPMHQPGSGPMNALQRRLDGDFNIVIAHCPVEGFTGWTADEPIIRISAIPSEVNLLVVGHFHNHQTKRIGGTQIVYPGSTERVDIAEEPDRKGFVWAEFEKDGTLSQRFIETSARRYKTVRLQFPEVQNPLDALEHELEKSFDIELILRVKLAGTVSPLNLAGYRRSELEMFARGKVFHCFVDEDELVPTTPGVTDVGPRRTPLAELDTYFEGKMGTATDQEKEILREALQLSRAKLTEAGAW